MVAPLGLNGGLPGRSASEVWWQLQFDVECSLLHSEVMAGISLDLSKAFNTLPRTPVFALGSKAGLPQQLTTAWSGAVSGCCRRFQIRGSVGPPLLSCTGFPEGCALSVVSMVLVDMAVHWHVTKVVPSASITTFVDDWKTKASSAEDAVRALRAAEQFAVMWDLTLDRSKSVAWATSSLARKVLRQQGLPVVLATRDLGGHVSFCKKKSNFTLADRTKKLDAIWPRLQASSSPYRYKVRALWSSAWPKALYGASVTLIGRNHMQVLRSGALRGLNARRPGANPLLHLSLLEFPLADPGYFALRTSVQDLVRYGSSAQFAMVASEVLAHPHSPVPGPVSALLERCHEAGLSWDGETQAFQDSWGKFCPFTASPQEVEQRLAIQWQQCAADKVALWPGFQGMSHVDPVLTRKLLNELAPDDQACARVALNGTFFTEDRLCHIGESDSPACPYCKQHDHIMHRVWYCPALAAARTRASGHFPVQPQLLHPCQAEHAWAMFPESLHALRQALIQPRVSLSMHLQWAS